MPEAVCCVCRERLTPPFKTIDGRLYCDRHYATVNKPHGGFWRAGIVQIIGMGVLSAVIAVLAGYLPPLDQAGSMMAGILLAVIPTALWVVYFYRQDQLEPEPKTRIAEVLLLALLLTAAIGLPLIGLFRLADWANTNQFVSLLAYILIGGFTYETIKYFAVRLVVYATPEFDERMDGIVYGSIAGLGVASLLGLHHVIDNQGVALAPGIIYAVTTALAQASFGGVMGYFMSQAKFEHRPVWWIPVGVSLAALLDGVYSWLVGEVSMVGLTVDPWRSLLLGLAVALVTFLILIALMQRAMNIDMKQPSVPES
ncbi:MAG: PrsW family glutamic-type intramembrane protease [Anaerolineae bacterium]